MRIHPTRERRRRSKGEAMRGLAIRIVERCSTHVSSARKMAISAFVLCGRRRSGDARYINRSRPRGAAAARFVTDVVLLSDGIAIAAVGEVPTRDGRVPGHAHPLDWAKGIVASRG